MLVDVADDIGRRDAADPAEARDRRDLAEEQVRDHGVRQRDHQEVNADTPARERAEEKRGGHGDADPEHDAEPRVPAEIHSLRVAVRRDVAEDEARDPEDRHLRKRDHAAVGVQEDEAGGDDPEEEHLREERRDPVRAEDERRERGEDERGDPDDAVRRHGDPHAGLPKSPKGRTARTTATSAKVKMIE